LQKSRHLILFGEDGVNHVSTKVMKLLGLMRVKEGQISQVVTLDEAVKRASEIAIAGDVVLLSPGGTSYDAYDNFALRGEHFRQLVSEL